HGGHGDPPGASRHHPGGRRRGVLPVLTVVELRARSGAERHRRPVQRDDDLAPARPRAVRGVRLAGVLAAVAALVAPAATAGAVGPRRLTVMTFNIAHACLAPGGLSGVAAVIRSGRPDVVGLQEVDRSWSRSGGVDQAVEL